MSKSSSANSDLSEGTRGRQVPTIGRSSDPCRVCAKSVFILERLNVGGRILHRTCFKCARYHRFGGLQNGVMGAPHFWLDWLRSERD